MKDTRCSFCGREKREVEMLIAGIDGHICDMCVEQAGEIIDTELDTKDDEAKTEIAKVKVKTPKEN